MALWKYHRHLSFSSGEMPWATVQRITFGGAPVAGDKYKVTYGGATSADIVIDTNSTATHVRDILRTLTGDASLTVTGTDTTNMVVTFVDETPTDIIGTTGATGMTAAVTVEPTYTIPLKGSGPYKIYRIVTVDEASVGTPTFELTGVSTHPASTTELADESPGEAVIPATPVIFDSLLFSGLLFQDTDIVGITVYYESAGDRRF